MIKDSSIYKLSCYEEGELVNAKEIEPPYLSGTVYVYSKNILRAMGEYLSIAYREKVENKWRIQALGYKDKIRFAKQSEEMLDSIKMIGFSVSGILFFFFLSTNLMINIRNKAPEIAIFRAMGATIFSIIYIFIIQVLIIIISAVIVSSIFVSVIIPYMQNLFIKNIIHQVWNNYDEQREATVLISNTSFWDSLFSVYATNSNIIILSIFFVIFIVSMSLLWVRFHPTYSISKILKER